MATRTSLLVRDHARHALLITVRWHITVGPRTYATTTGIAGLQRDSREKTIANGNQKISQFAAMLAINHTVVETAQVRVVSLSCLLVRSHARFV